MSRLEKRFADLAGRGRPGFVVYLQAGDPDYATSLELLRALPGAGADVIEVGMPFTDPMADGPAIQAAGLRALAAGMSLARVLELVGSFRAEDAKTPIVLMGYYNPIYAFGPERFLEAAVRAGVDGLIVVDLPPEEDGELCLPARAKGLDFIRLATPTTDDARLPAVLSNSSGFLYYVSVAGITGQKAAVADRVAPEVARIKKHTDLPVAVGFGIRTPAQARDIGRIADAAVVGTALVDVLAENLDAAGRAKPGLVAAVTGRTRELADAVHGARTDREQRP